MTSSTTTCHATRRARVARSHHRTSWGHGPAHAVIAPPPRGSTDTAQRGRWGRQLAASGDHHRPAVTVDQLRRGSGIQHPCRGRTGNRAGPGWLLDRHRARHGTERRVRCRFTRLAPGHPADPLGRGSAALGHRGDDVLGAEQTLETSKHPSRAFGCRGIAAPEPELAARCGDHLIGDQSQPGQAAAQPTGRGSAIRRAATAPVRPALPGSAHHRGATRATSVSPCSVSASTITWVQARPRAASRSSRPIGQDLGHEGRGIDPFRRRIQLTLLVEVRWRGGERGRMRVLTPREPVRDETLPAQPGQHRARGQLARTRPGCAARAERGDRPARRHPAHPPARARGMSASPPWPRSHFAGRRGAPRTHRRQSRCAHRPRRPRATASRIRSTSPPSPPW